MAPLYCLHFRADELLGIWFKRLAGLAGRLVSLERLKWLKRRSHKRVKEETGSLFDWSIYKREEAACVPLLHQLQLSSNRASQPQSLLGFLQLYESTRASQVSTFLLEKKLITHSVEWTHWNCFQSLVNGSAQTSKHLVWIAIHHTSYASQLLATFSRASSTWPVLAFHFGTFLKFSTRILIFFPSSLPLEMCVPN